jgi:hypothetical protein
MHQSEVANEVCMPGLFRARRADRFTLEEGAKLTEDSMAYDRFLECRGNLIMAQALEAPQTAVTIRVRNGKLSSTDGQPFARRKLARPKLCSTERLNGSTSLRRAWSPMEATARPIWSGGWWTSAGSNRT